MHGRIQVQRLAPALPPSAVKTYQVVAPPATHWRPATCAEVDCTAHLNGWRTILPADREDLLHAARSSGRAYTETAGGPGLVEFTFAAGQACFRASEHRVRTGRPELYVVREGDWRGNPRGGPPRVHARPDDWVDDFATHQDRLAERLRQG